MRRWALRVLVGPVVEMWLVVLGGGGSGSGVMSDAAAGRLDTTTGRPSQ